MFRKLKGFMMIATLWSFSVAANATPITGAIGFGGLFAPWGGAGTDLSDATGIDIGFSQVVAATDDFLPAVGFNAVFAHIDFNPPNTPVTPLWTVTAGTITFSFDLLNIAVDFQGADELILSAEGTLMATGFDDTPGTWTFSGQQLNNFFTVSSLSAADAAVPIPATLALFGLGLAGLGWSRHKKGDRPRLIW